MRVFIDVAVFELNHVDAASVRHALEPSKYLVFVAFYIDFQKVNKADILRFCFFVPAAGSDQALIRFRDNLERANFSGRAELTGH